MNNQRKGVSSVQSVIYSFIIFHPLQSLDISPQPSNIIRSSNINLYRLKVHARISLIATRS